MKNQFGKFSGPGRSDFFSGYSKIPTIFFRGRDGKNRMILLMLTTPKIKKGEAFEEAVKNVSLQLSYLLNPDNPDILTVKDDDF